MKDDLQSVVNSMKDNKFSFISKDFKTEDIMKILKEVGKFIRDHQLRGYAVSVKGIGLFTMFQQKLLISHHPVKYIISQKPVFQLSHSLASKFRVKWARQIADYKLPQKLLNPSTIAYKCGTDRSKVILVLHELVTFIENSLSVKNKVRVPIYGVGVIKIDEDEWKMEFSTEYVKALSKCDVPYIVKDL